MPVIISAGSKSKVGIIPGESLELVKGEYKSRYPNGVNLNPSSEMHGQLVTEIINRTQASRSREQDSHIKWRKIDHMLSAFVTPDEAERLEKRKDFRRPVRIVLPQMYSNLQTLLAITTVGMGQRPFYRFESASRPIEAALLERVMSQQANRLSHLPALYTRWRDGYAYGRGVIAPRWIEKHGTRTSWEQTTVKSKIILPGGDIVTGRKRVRKKAKLFEGHELDNIDPYMYLPDPNFPVDKVQKGEFTGWIERSNFINLFKREREDSMFFNVKHLFNRRGESVYYRQDDNVRDAFGLTRSNKVDRSTVNFTATTTEDVIWMYIKLIPKDWKLGKTEEPKIWLFGLAADSIIIVAHEMDLDHNMFPVAVVAPTFDGYSPHPISTMEVGFGLQETSDWFITSHIKNVTATVNNSFIVDPSIVNLNDFKDGGAGRIIRIRRRYFGDPNAVDKGVKQLDINDVTRNNVNDAQFFDFWAGKGAGISPSLQGIQERSGSRVSASEASGTRQSGLSRIEQGMTLMFEQDTLPYLLASQTLQFMEEEVFVNIAGREEQILRKEFGKDENVAINPWDLSPDYDLTPRTGDLPNGDFSQGLLQALTLAMQDPELRQQVDIFRLFQHVTRQMGARHIHEFTRAGGGLQAETQPTEQVENAVAAGNLVPLPLNTTGVA